MRKTDFTPEAFEKNSEDITIEDVIDKGFFATFVEGMEKEMQSAYDEKKAETGNGQLMVGVAVDDDLTIHWSIVVLNAEWPITSLLKSFLFKGEVSLPLVYQSANTLIAAKKENGVFVYKDICELIGDAATNYLHISETGEEVVDMFSLSEKESIPLEFVVACLQDMNRKGRKHFDLQTGTLHNMH